MGCGLLRKHLGSMSTVLLHGGTNSIELHGVVSSHGLHASIVGSLVGSNELSKLLVLLKVLLVTLVADGDHALHLSLHIGVHLGLSDLVLLDDTGKGSHASIGCSDLLVDSRTEEHDLALESDLSIVDTLLSLSLGSSDVLHVLREALGLGSSLSIEGSIHTAGCSLQSHVSVLAVGSHLGADTSELSLGLRDNNLELVVSPLTDLLVLVLELSSQLGATSSSQSTSICSLLVELVHCLVEGLAGGLSITLDLSSIGRHMLVGLGDLSIGCGLESRHCALLHEDSILEVVSCVLLVLGNLLAESHLLGSIELLALVGNHSVICESSLHEAHGPLQVVCSELGIGSHLVAEHLLEAATSSSIEGHVPVHLLADSLNIALASSFLSSDLLLDVAKVVRQAHAAIRGVGEDGSCLLDVLGADRLRSIPIQRVCSGCTIIEVAGGSNDLIGTIGGNVHNRATDGKSTQQTKGYACTRHLAYASCSCGPM